MTPSENDIHAAVGQLINLQRWLSNFDDEDEKIKTALMRCRKSINALLPEKPETTEPATVEP